MKQHIHKLIQYGLNTSLITPLDIDYVNNRLSALLKVEPDIFQTVDIKHQTIDEILDPLLEHAFHVGLITSNTVTERDLIEAEIMNIFMPRPSDYQVLFTVLHQRNPMDATNHFYQQSISTNYIKSERIKKNIFYQADTTYGKMDITINLAKPEKDPRAIAKALKEKQATRYPECLLCKENVGYQGHLNHPGRANHRIVKVELNHEPFYLQYSPYLYYNEHAILLHEDHIPMEVGKKTFLRLFDFVDMFPHYFMGSNAGLPIVGGSILSHEHYQGGRAVFPLHHAKILKSYQKNNVTYEILHWPLSILRLSSNKKDELIEAAEAIRLAWLVYHNPDIDIIKATGNQPHNAITPILRKENEIYVLDIALRNNRTNDLYPDGIFHPHPEHHHIKKENIGLIEVMGLAILPGRLHQDLEAIKDILLGKRSTFDGITTYQHWIDHLKKIYHHDDIDIFIQQEVAKEFVMGLEDCGVFKQDLKGQTAFDTFLINHLKG